MWWISGELVLVHPANNRLDLVVVVLVKMRLLAPSALMMELQWKETNHNLECIARPSMCLYYKMALTYRYLRAY